MTDSVWKTLIQILCNYQLVWPYLKLLELDITSSNTELEYEKL